jgi:putative membrane protein
VGSNATALSPIDLLTRARLEPLALAVIVVSTCWYLWRLHRLAASGKRWPALRTASWCLAELALAVAWLSGLASYSNNSFAIPATGHILSAMVAPIFFALAAPLSLAIRSSSPSTKATLIGAIRSTWASYAFHPVTAWAIYAASLFGYYFTSLYRLSVEHPLLGQAARLELLLAGCLWMWPAAAADPLPRRLGHFGRVFYLILSMPVLTIFGMGLESTTKTILASVPVSSVHLGGGLIWVAGEAIGLLGAIAVFVGWLRSDERGVRSFERFNEVSAQKQLERWRAAREAAARAR